ncbi:hypothetical protein HanXRQr2_Chr16g0773531 [Helianthus annuus]|uniref:Uncharacterized protein n=1 Tax=Helianthus annuus TaxID=4232 RepID=A0A9K3H0R4_HELAN|nr:hypothetical protein HanXRQr2_Chr16g0773531 [Helianthus annuus]KAJ0823285.1 hypothetical protein HanPSC8_Chr16g0741961 [Helianthus annuus]
MEWKRYHLHSSKLACIIQMLILQSAGQFKRPYRHYKARVGPDYKVDQP